MSIISVVAATLLRYNMPDSSEFNQSHKQIAEETYRRHQQRDGVSADGQTVVTDVEGQAGAQRQQYVPVLELFRGHWRGLLLQSLYGCCKYMTAIRWAWALSVKHSTCLTLLLCIKSMSGAAPLIDWSNLHSMLNAHNSVTECTYDGVNWEVTGLLQSGPRSCQHTRIQSQIHES